MSLLLQQFVQILHQFSILNRSEVLGLSLGVVPVQKLRQPVSDEELVLHNLVKSLLLHKFLVVLTERHLHVGVNGGTTTIAREYRRSPTSGWQIVILQSLQADSKPVAAQSCECESTGLPIVVEVEPLF